MANRTSSLAASSVTGLGVQSALRADLGEVCLDNDRVLIDEALIVSSDAVSSEQYRNTVHRGVNCQYNEAKSVRAANDVTVSSMRPSSEERAGQQQDLC